MLGLIASLLIIVVLLALFARTQQQLAQQQRETARKAETFAKEQQRLRLISLAQALAARTLRKHDDRGALLARQGYVFHQRSHGHVPDQIDDSLRTILSSPDFSNVLRGHEDAVYSVAFSPAGQTLASGSGDQTIFVWIARTEILAEKICQQVWRNLTLDEWHQFVGEDLPYERTCPSLLAGSEVPAETQGTTP